MQFKNYFITFVFIGLIALAFGTRLLNKNKIQSNEKENMQNKAKTSVFAEENFELSEEEKLDDLVEQKVLASIKRKNTDSKSK